MDITTQYSMFKFNPITNRLDLVGSSATNNFADAEVPSGDINDSNVEFVLVHPPSSSLQLFLNGQLMTATIDYTLSTNTITMTSPPPSGSGIICWYRY